VVRNTSALPSSAQAKCNGVEGTETELLETPGALRRHPGRNHDFISEQEQRLGVVTTLGNWAAANLNVQHRTGHPGSQTLTYYPHYVLDRFCFPTNAQLALIVCKTT
jgi:hypothetical protein